MTVVDGSLGYPLPNEEHATMPLAGGIAGMGFQCGQVWGAALAAGAQAYRLYGPGARAQAAAVIATQQLVEAFRSRYKSINCSDVTQMEWKNTGGAQVVGYLLKGGPIRCFSMTAGYARVVYRQINTAFDEADPPTLAPPLSCAALLAQKMGASEMQVVMAAGLAGGIGLSGAACGALGTAIWIHTLNKGGKVTFDFNDPEITDTVDRFVESTEIKFDCSEIVGRKFQDVSDHAAYLQAGGCSKILETLAKNGAAS